MIEFRTLGTTGRLGNALFQLAATVGVAHRRGEMVSFNENWLHRPYFSVPDDWFSLWRGTPLEETPELAHIDPRARIYAQDISLFEEVLPMLRHVLRPSPVAREILDGSDCYEFNLLPHPILSVHVRRGDNVVDPGVPDKWNYHVCPPLSYYQEAIKRLRDQAASVAVFSDDPAWCREHLTEADYIHEGVPRPKEHESDYLTAPVLDWIDLQLSAQCEMHIVSGSTYGIWGALLAGDTDAIHSWPIYGPKLSYIDAALLFPRSWQRLEHPVEAR